MEFKTIASTCPCSVEQILGADSHTSKPSSNSWYHRHTRAMSKIIRITVSLLTILVLCMYIVSLCTSFWQKTEYKAKSKGGYIQATHSGLWHGCYVHYHGKAQCGYIYREKAWLKAVRAFFIIGIIATLLAFGFVCFTYYDCDASFMFAGILHALAALFILIALSVYAAKSGLPFDRDGHEGTFEWSFIIAWVTWLFTVVACVLSFLDDDEPVFQHA